MPSSVSGVQTCALDRKSTRLNSSHTITSYAVFCLEKKRGEHAATLVAELDRVLLSGGRLVVLAAPAGEQHHVVFLELVFLIDQGPPLGRIVAAGRPVA